MKDFNQEVKILEAIQSGKEVISQRDIAKIAGISLGMTNIIIKRLIDKGLLKARGINNRKLKYLLTPEGLETISIKGRNYFKGTIKKIVLFKDAIDLIIIDLSNNGITAINFTGDSDYYFLIEYSCLKHDIDIYHNSELKDIYKLEAIDIENMILNKMSKLGDKE